jgi:tetratricopeptide (TPR) repeat protein
MVHTSSGGAAALPLYERAIALDPSFAMAYAALGHLYGEIGESDLSAENTRKAWQFRDRASDPEKFFITATYELRVLGNAEKLQATCEAWTRSYPREVHAHGLLAGGVYPVKGNYQKGFEEAKKANSLDPDWALGYGLVADYASLLGQMSEAQGALQKAAARKLDIPEFLESRHRIAFLKGDRAGMERELALSTKKPEMEAALSYMDAFALAYSGHLQQARIRSRRAFDLAQQTGHPERAALYLAGAAVRDAFFGNAVEARRSAREALALSADREVEYGAAFALALIEDGLQAQKLADDLEKRFPEDTSVRFNYLPAIRARVELNHANASKAMDLLQVAVPHELGTPRSGSHGLFGTLYPIYLRGEAYLKARNPADAASEFEKVLAHVPIVMSDPVGAIARLQLGRALALSGDVAKSKAAYRAFLDLWKDADADIPILKQAKAEFAKL